VSKDKKYSLNALKELAMIYEQVGKKERLRNVLKRIIMFEKDEDIKLLISQSLNRF
jgi:lipopolysaccharide biosynthesis regulator YciM